jgi:type I restriction enzyme S subunit
MSDPLDPVTGELRRYRPYPEYKDSGVEWLGEIPKHWDVAPVYSRYEVALGKMLDAKKISGDSSGPYLRNVDVQWDAVNVDSLPEMDFSPSERERYGLRTGDILVCEGGEVGRTAIWNGQLDPCFYQKALHRVRPRSPHDVPRFFYYLMHSMAKRGVFAAGGNPNTIDHLTAVQLRHYRFPFGPASEQRAIAAFLDRETARIDALVAKKERLVELLQEKRTALITRAVTKGLASNPRSGIACFSELPPGWTMRKLRRLIRQVKRPVEVELDREYREIGIRSWGKGVFHKAPTIGVHLANKSVFYIQPGDLVLNIVFAWEGAVGVVSDREKGMIASHRFPTFRPSKEVDLDYLLLFLQSEHGRSIMAVNSPGAAGRNKTIRLAQFLDEEVPLPPFSEQRDIVGTFRTEEKRLRILRAKVRQATERLKELRTALISAAVTGKIDVRGFAAGESSEEITPSAP